MLLARSQSTHQEKQETEATSGLRNSLPTGGREPGIFRLCAAPRQAGPPCVLKTPGGPAVHLRSAGLPPHTSGGRLAQAHSPPRAQSQRERTAGRTHVAMSLHRPPASGSPRVTCQPVRLAPPRAPLLGATPPLLLHRPARLGEAARVKVDARCGRFPGLLRARLSPADQAGVLHCSPALPRFSPGWRC